MLTLVDKQGKEAVTTCNGCGMYRLCREWRPSDVYKDRRQLWLCVNGPCKCYRHRKAVKADKQRASTRKESGE